MISVAGIVPFTTIDFPDHLAAVIFFKGCPLKCPFCHNPDLQKLEPTEQSWEETMAFLNERAKRLEGVVLSGGEPLMQPQIINIVNEIKQMGFLIGIHTSGVYPDKLALLAHKIDWVGLDVKAPWNKYELLCGRSGTAQKVKESLKILQESHVSFEVRTTCDPRYLTKEDIYILTDDLNDLGITHYAMQKYRTFEGDKNPPSDYECNAFFQDKKWLHSIQSKFPHFLTR